MEPHRLSILLDKYTQGLATPDELKELNKWYRNKAYQNATFQENEEDVKARMLTSLMQNIKPAINEAPYRWIAAAVLLFICAGSYLLLKPSAVKVSTPVAKAHDVIKPGSTNAVLTIAGGKRIELNSVNAGTLVTQAGTTVSKTTDGKLIYKATGNEINNTIYNTLITPNGGQYNITLPDGTRVWLNAATSLTFPTSFKGEQREVKLVGEAYFEVAKNPGKPFKINVAGRQEVLVLGTHFNIEAYPDESSITTTLLEGSVKLVANQQAILMNPGETVINSISGQIKKERADQESVMAWKNGLFVFNDEDIESAMRKTARWYDVDIEYQKGIRHKRLGGVISKYKNITDLLDNIGKSNGIHYKIEGRRVTLTQ